MNKEVAQGIVSDKLQSITFFEDASLLIGKHVLNQFDLGTYFIDYSDESFTFNLRDYQEKYISSEYYKTSGPAQWNQYLIFLREKYSEEEKKLVEKDGVYTRKFVFTPEEFNNYFDYHQSEQVVEGDVISIWKEKLRNVDLDEVYSEAPYTQAVHRFLSEDVIKDIENNHNSTEDRQELKIKKVSYLKLNETYRRFPLQREFDLGQVNLITGVNGVGKTSFLESLELVIGGKSIRDPFSNEAYGSIEARYNDETDDSYTPGDNAKYRSRDIAWYSSAYKSGNELFRAFNKYNFYDSDAAFALSHNSNIGDITKYLSSIALGTEFNRIQDRLNGFRSRLNQELRNRVQIIDGEKARIIEGKKILEKNHQTTTPEESFQSFLNHSKKINWKGALPKTHQYSFQTFNENYQTTQSLINSLDKILIPLKLQSVKSILDEHTRLNGILNECKKFKVRIDKLKEGLTTKKLELELVGKQVDILESAKKFYQDESSFKLWKLNESIDQLSVNINQKTRALIYFDKVSDQKIFEESLSLESAKRTLFVNREELTEKSKDLSQRIERLKSNLSKLQQVVSDIKKLGKQYLTVNKTANSCPLCETPYSFEELSARVADIAKEVDTNIELDGLNTDLLLIDSQLSEVKSSIVNIQHIESGISSLSEKEYLNMSLSEIGKKYREVKKSLHESTENRSELERIKEELGDKDLYEEEFNRLKQEIENTIENIQFRYEDKNRFNKILSVRGERRSELKKEISISEDEQKELSTSLRDILEKNAVDVDFSNFETELTYKIELLQKGNAYFIDLGNYLDFDTQDDIADISQRVDKLWKLYESIDKALRSQKDLTIANEMITKSEARINDIQPVCDRISSGLSVISDILENYGESKVLGSFIEKNETEIQEIFRSIHSPKEFSHISFDQTVDSVLLTRKNDGSKVPINKISTGQRSALALSIFLALNKKLNNGPNLILFDDPVSFTDDLNILSFLDYLREMVIQENRQVIFATANQKLAGLFEKKFAFIGSDQFQKFHFER